MRPMLTILRRELTSYFTGPIGYIYLVTFLLFTNVLALFTIRGKSFFEMPVADMREYFHVVAAVAAFLVAAVTMRLWSEERKENTFEMLLTFPMSARDLVLGKFMASLGFFKIALAGTFTVPLMIVWLSRSGDDALTQSGFFGMLDIGPTVSGYFGAVLLGGLFISFGLFISSLCRDQIVAFVLTAPALFFAYILGISKIMQDLNEALAFIGEDMGTWIGDFVGIFVHYDNLARGLVTGSDILFFVVWIAIFLVLNGLAIERRNRTNCNLMFAAAVVMMILIGCAANNLLFMKSSLGRWDVTGEKIFTIDPVSKDVLSGLDDKVNIRYIVTPRSRMPAEMQDLERSVRDKLDALKVVSGGKLNYQVIYQEAIGQLEDDTKAEAEKPGDSIKKRILKKIKPFPVEGGSTDEVSLKMIYSGMEISYGDKESEVINQLVPDHMWQQQVVRVSQLEYNLVNYVHKMTRTDTPVVVMLAPVKKLDPQMAMYFQQMGRQVPPPEDNYQIIEYYLRQEGFDVKRISLSKNEPMPAKYDALLVLEPKELSERALWEINRSLVNGKPAFMAVQKNIFEYNMSIEGNISARRVPIKTAIDKVLVASGIKTGNAQLMDKNAVVANIPTRTPLGTFQQPFPKELRMHSLLKGGNLKSDHQMLQSVTQITYIWGTTVDYDKKELSGKGITDTVLLAGGPECWTRMLVADQLSAQDIALPSDPKEYRTFPLAVLFEGQFADAYAGKAIPDWPAEQPNPMEQQRPPEYEVGGTAIEPKPGKLVLVANSMPFNQNFITWPEWQFLLNSVSSLVLDDKGLAIRALRTKSYQSRLMPAIPATSMQAWKFIQFGAPLLVITAAGIAMMLYRKRRRESYAASLKSI